MAVIPRALGWGSLMTSMIIPNLRRMAPDEEAPDATPPVMQPMSPDQSTADLEERAHGGTADLEAHREITPHMNPMLQQEAVEPSPQGPPPTGKQRFHNTMADFEHRAEANRAEMIGLDPSDPDYAKKLSALQAQHGALTTEKARYQMLHPWGGPESAHPGVLGKIGHVAGKIGQIAGEAIRPDVVQAIPGTQSNLASQGAAGEKEMAAGEAGAEKAAQTGEAEARTGQAKAATEHTQAETEELKNKPEPTENLQQEYTDAVTDAQSRGVDPATDPKVMQLQNAITATQKETAQKPPHVTYDSGIPVSVTDAVGHVFDVNDPKLPPELKPLVQAAQRAHGQHIQEEASKQGAAFAQQEKMFNERQGALTNATKTMLEAAPHVEHFVQRIRPVIDKLEASGELGPAAGRWNEFWTGKVGTRDREFTKLRTDVGLLTTLLMRMHAGARGGEYIMQHFSDIINQGKQAPDNMRAALGEIEAYARQLQSERGGENSITGGGGGPTNTSRPSFADWKASQGQPK